MDINIVQAFGQNLKMIRRNKGLSQKDLAKIIDKHETHISRYERDLTEPSLKVAKQISIALKVSIDRLVSNTPEIGSVVQDSNLKSLFLQCQKLSPSKMNVVSALIKAFIFKDYVEKNIGTKSNLTMQTNFIKTRSIREGEIGFDFFST